MQTLGLVDDKVLEHLHKSVALAGLQSRQPSTRLAAVIYLSFRVQDALKLFQGPFCYRDAETSLARRSVRSSLTQHWFRFTTGIVSRVGLSVVKKEIVTWRLFLLWQRRL